MFRNWSVKVNSGESCLMWNYKLRNVNTAFIVQMLLQRIYEWICSYSMWQTKPDVSKEDNTKYTSWLCKHNSPGKSRCSGWCDWPQWCPALTTPQWGRGHPGPAHPPARHGARKATAVKRAGSWQHPDPARCGRGTAGGRSHRVPACNTGGAAVAPTRPPLALSWSHRRKAAWRTDAGWACGAAGAGVPETPASRTCTAAPASPLP